eukprot:GHVT01097726.1.p2 GENE.GHVT01097726.1~~GHVT01097726.1.p2  ORF type:complete len:171 (+),score=8.27 GHVT01097726.1:77-589(+)
MEGAGGSNETMNTVGTTESESYTRLSITMTKHPSLETLATPRTRRLSLAPLPPIGPQTARSGSREGVDQVDGGSSSLPPPRERSSSCSSISRRTSIQNEMRRSSQAEIEHLMSARSRSSLTSPTPATLLAGTRKGSGIAPWTPDATDSLADMKACRQLRLHSPAEEEDEQ